MVRSNWASVGIRIGMFSQMESKLSPPASAAKEPDLDLDARGCLVEGRGDGVCLRLGQIPVHIPCRVDGVPVLPRRLEGYAVGVQLDPGVDVQVLRVVCLKPDTGEQIGCIDSGEVRREGDPEVHIASEVFASVMRYGEIVLVRQAPPLLACDRPGARRERPGAAVGPQGLVVVDVAHRGHARRGLFVGSEVPYVRRDVGHESRGVAVHPVLRASVPADVGNDARLVLGEVVVEPPRCIERRVQSRLVGEIPDVEGDALERGLPRRSLVHHLRDGGVELAVLDDQLVDRVVTGRNSDEDTLLGALGDPRVRVTAGRTGSLDDLLAVGAGPCRGSGIERLTRGRLLAGGDDGTTDRIGSWRKWHQTSLAFSPPSRVAFCRLTLTISFPATPL